MAFNLTVGGIHFLKNGVPTFLWGPTYFDVLDWTPSDITDATDAGANLFRIILDKQFEPDGPNNTQTIFNANGSLRTTATNTVHAFLTACENAGAAVDVTILVGDGVPNSVDWLTTQAARVAAVTNAVNALKTHPNILFDVFNEYNYAPNLADPWGETQVLLNAAFAAYPTGIIGASGGGGFRGLTPNGYWIEYDTENLITSQINQYVAMGANFGSPHNCRDRQWPAKTESRAAALRAYLTSISYNKPLYFSEEGRVGSTEDGDPSAAELVQAIVGARDGGAAACIFHTRAAFNLLLGSMFSQFTFGESQAFSNIQDALGPPPDLTPPAPPTGISVE